MKVPTDARFFEQRARLCLRFTCESCAHFDVENEACVQGYPTEEHRDAFYDAPGCAVVVFCKYYELV